VKTLTHFILVPKPVKGDNLENIIIDAVIDEITENFDYIILIKEQSIYKRYDDFDAMFA
jgi:hypothetical protein